MYMFPEGTPDPEYPNDVNQTGVRKDKRNLVQEWQAKHQVMGAHGCRVQRGQAWGVGLWAEAWFCPPREPSMCGTAQRSFRQPVTPV